VNEIEKSAALQEEEAKESISVAEGAAKKTDPTVASFAAEGATKKTEPTVASSTINEN